MSLTDAMSAPLLIETRSWCGFRLRITGATSVFNTQSRPWMLFFPAWFIPCVYPTIPFIPVPWRRHRRRRRGLCIRCGYNLEVNVSGMGSVCGNEVGRSTT